MRSAILALILILEGGLTHHAQDRGGVTNFGITARYHRDVDVEHLDRGTATRIYTELWDKSQAGRLPWPLSMHYFDCYINMGARPCPRMLQMALGVRPDGRLGRATWAAVDHVRASGRAAEVSMRFMAIRLRRMAEMRTWPTFSRGWVQRAALLLEESAKPAPAQAW
jgi:lysozyme family protein